MHEEKLSPNFYFIQQPKTHAFKGKHMQILWSLRDRQIFLRWQKLISTGNDELGFMKNKLN